MLHASANHSVIPGYEVALHRALTEPILLAGAPRSFAILNGTLAAAIGLGLRLWIAGAADLARRPCRRRVGHAQGPGLPHRAVPPRPPQGSADMLNLAEYRTQKHRPLRLPAVGLPGRARHRPQQGRLLPAHAALPRPRPRQRHRGRTGLGQRPAQQCPEALRRGLGPVLRGRAHPGQPAIPAPALPIRRRGWSTRSATPPSAPTAPTTKAAIS